jgi:hypothetical protein
MSKNDNSCPIHWNCAGKPPQNCRSNINCSKTKSSDERMRIRSGLGRARSREVTSENKEHIRVNHGGKQTEVPGGTRGYSGTPAYPIYDNQEVRGGTRGTRGYPARGKRAGSARGYPRYAGDSGSGFLPGRKRYRRVSPREKCDTCEFLPGRKRYRRVSPREKCDTC